MPSIGHILKKTPGRCNESKFMSLKFILYKENQSKIHKSL